MIVLQIDSNSHKIQKYIADCFDCDHDATIDLKLQPGDYYIIVEMDWKSDAIREVGLSFYGQHPVNLMEDTTFLSFDQLFNQIVLAHEAYTNRDRVLNYPTDTSIRRISGSFAGYVYYHYSNKSKKNNYLCESVVLKNRTNIRVVGENRPGFFIARVHPEEEKIVKLKVQSQANGYYSFSTKIQYYIVERYDLEQLRDITDQKPSKIKKREADQKQINVKVKTYSYSGGLALLYQNKMDKYTYIEDIEFQFENLELENELLDSDHKMKIVLPSKKQKLLSFVIISPDREVRFKTKVSFELKSEHEIS